MHDHLRQGRTAVAVHPRRHDAGRRGQGDAGRGVDAEHARAQHAEGVVPVGIGGDCPALVVARGCQVVVGPAPGQGHVLALQAGAVRRGAGGGAVGVVPQGAADETDARAVAVQIDVGRGARARAFAARGTCRAHVGAGIALEAVRQAGVGHRGRGVGQQHVVGQVGRVGQADGLTRRQLVHGDGDLSAHHRNADAGWVAARCVGGAVDGEADHGQVLPARGQGVGEPDVVGGGAAGIAERHAVGGLARRRAHAGVERRDALVQVVDLGFHHALDRGIRAGAHLAAAQEIRLDRQLLARDDARRIVHADVEFEVHHFEIRIVIAVDQRAQLQHHRARIAGVDVRLVDDALRAHAGQVGGQQGLRFVREAALQVGVAGHDQPGQVGLYAGTATGQRVGNEGQGGGAVVHEGQALRQDHADGGVGVGAFGHHEGHAVMDDLAHGHVLRIGGGRRTGRRIRQPAYMTDRGVRRHALGQGVGQGVVIHAARARAFVRGSPVHAGPLHADLVVDRPGNAGGGVQRAREAQHHRPALGNVELGALGGLQHAVDDDEISPGQGGAAIQRDAQYLRAGQLGRQHVLHADVVGVHVGGGGAVAYRDGIGQHVAPVHAHRGARTDRRLRQVQGGFNNGDSGPRALRGHVAVGRRGAVGGVGVGVAVDELRVVGPHRARLVGRHIQRHQRHADHEAVVTRNVVAGGGTGAEAQAHVRAIRAGRAADARDGRHRHRAGEVRRQRGAAGRGGDELVAAVAKARVQPHAGGNQVFQAQVLRDAFGQRHDDVVEHALAHHQIAAGCVRRVGVARIQRAPGIADGDGGRGHHGVGRVG